MQNQPPQMNVVLASHVSLQGCHLVMDVEQWRCRYSHYVAKEYGRRSPTIGIRWITLRLISNQNENGEQAYVVVANSFAMINYGTRLAVL